MKYNDHTKATDPVTGMMDTEHVEGFIGLTKREHFAAMALQSLISNMQNSDFLRAVRTRSQLEGVLDVEYICTMATEYAYTLITALNK